LYLLASLRALLQIPAKLLFAPRRLLSLSVPARVSGLMGLFLVLVTTAAFVSYLLTPDRPSWQTWFELWHILVLGGLIVAIPILTYVMLKLWLEGTSSAFPEIDASWQRGLLEIQRAGLAVNDMPIFLVFGFSGPRDVKNLMEASGLEFVVRCDEDIQAPMHWYGNEQGIFLVLNDVGRFALVHHSQGDWPTGGASLERQSAPQGDIRGTIVAGSRPAALSPSPARAASESDFGRPGSAGIRGTLMPGASFPDQSPGNATHDPTRPQAVPTVLPRGKLDEQSYRLHYLCSLLSQLRQPVCPLNGALLTLPWQKIKSQQDLRALSDALRRDLATVRESTQLCFPLTFLVNGMETENGFAELVRRVGAEHASASRFGHRFDHWVHLTAENLEAFTANACGAFEDWVYDLFRQGDAMGKPGNAKLYQLLCTTRSQVHQRLTALLIGGFIEDERKHIQEDRTQLLTGCYFAGTGNSPDRQSFVKSVFTKMFQLEDDLEWTPSALQTNQRYRALAGLLYGANWLFLLGLLGLVAYKFLQ